VGWWSCSFASGMDSCEGGSTTLTRLDIAEMDSLRPSVVVYHIVGVGDEFVCSPGVKRGSTRTCMTRSGMTKSLSGFSHRVSPVTV